LEGVAEDSSDGRVIGGALAAHEHGADVFTEPKVSGRILSAALGHARV
jgi:hypothetical protein